MERVVSLGTVRLPFGKFGRILPSFSTPGLGGTGILWRRGGDSDLVAICSGGSQGDAVLVDVQLHR